MAAPKFFGLLFLAVAVATISTASATIHLHFYLFEAYTGDFPSASTVTQLNNTSGFGRIRVNDNFLRDAPGLTGAIIGKEQGFVAVTSQDGTSSTIVQTFLFTSGAYNGSSLTMVGTGSFDINSVSEIPIVGGTGLFRFARGYALIKILFSNPNLVYLEVNLYVLY